MRSATFAVPFLLVAFTAHASPPVDARCTGRPAPPSPTDADRATAARAGREAPGRSCSDWLFGLGGRADPAVARAVALVGGGCDAELAMIYGNGWGVTRDVDAALTFACRADGMSYPEIARLIGQLTDASTTAVDVCPFAESTFAMSRCAWIEAAQARDALEAEALVRRARWDAATAAAWRDVARAAARWASADAALRADEFRGGTLQKVSLPGHLANARRHLRARLVALGERPPAAAAPGELVLAVRRADRLASARRLASDSTWRALFDDEAAAAAALTDAWLRFVAARHGAAHVSAARLALTEARQLQLATLAPTAADFH
jgi:hypothetical protein